MKTDITKPEYFSRERIKRRMVKRAAEVWGFSENEVDTFDPLVKLLIEACSSELEKIASEINNTQNRLLDRLAHLMSPHIDTGKPAIGVLHTSSIESMSRLSKKDQFICRRSNRQQQEEFYFSPAIDTPIYGGDVKYIASNKGLWQIGKEQQKMLLSAGQQPSVLPWQPLWIGLELPPDITQLEGLPFFFYWKTGVKSDIWYQNLSLSNWYIGDGPLETTNGYGGVDHEDRETDLIEAEFNLMQKVEKEALDYYRRCFYTISKHEEMNLKDQRILFPTAFSQLYTQQALSSMKTPLLWIEVRMPHSIPLEALSELQCSINCFPVINRHLNNLTYRLQQNLNIVPLEAGNIFLSVHQVEDTNARKYKLIPWGNLLEIEEATCTLQFGVNRFDGRNTKEVLNNLLGQLRDESASFSALGEDFLSAMIKEFNQVISRLESKIAQSRLQQTPVPYLVVKPLQSGENIFIEYWTCDGEKANQIPAGSVLQPYSGMYVRQESIVMMATTHSGKEKMNENDKVNHYKKSLLIRNRIVTLEDVRAALVAELGAQVRDIRVSKSVMIGATPDSGLMRCIKVELTPSEPVTGLSSEDWEQRCKQLQHFLMRYSATNIPYFVTLLKNTLVA
jgi:hypothetical protein